MCFSWFRMLFFYNIDTLVLCRFLSNDQFSSNAANCFLKIVCSEVKEVSSNYIGWLILLSLNLYFICYEAHLFSQEPTSYYQVFDVKWGQKSHGQALNITYSKGPFSDMWNSFFIVSYLLNSKCRFIKFVF